MSTAPGLRAVKASVSILARMQRGLEAVLNVFSQSVSIAGLGTLVGAAGGWLIARWLAFLQYGVTAADPGTWSAVIAVLGLTAVAAAWRPARQAARIDPGWSGCGTIEKLAAEYASSGRPATMLAVLHAASKIEPVVGGDGLRADYTFAEPVAGERRLSLRKVDGRWYIRD